MSTIKTPYKAMILAAGKGTRLQPFTLTTPKPLLKINGITLIERNILALKKAGVKEIMINIAHLGDQIKSYIGSGKKYDLSIEYSVEPENSPLETGGAVKKVLPWFKEEIFILLSADIWTNYSFQNLLNVKLKQDLKSHIVVTNIPSWKKNADFHLDANNYINQSNNGKPVGYAGFGIFNPLAWENISEDYFPLKKVIDNILLHPKSMSAELYSGAWFNIGCEKRIQELKKFLK